MTITTFAATVPVLLGDPYTVIDPPAFDAQIYITSIIMRSATSAAVLDWAIALTPSDFDPSQVLFGNVGSTLPSPTGQDYYEFFPTPGDGTLAQSVSEGNTLYLNCILHGQTPEDTVAFDVFGYTVS